MERDIVFWAHTSGLIFVVVSIFCFLIKMFNVPKGEAVNRLSAWRSISLLFVFQVFQIPYLFDIGNSFALFYANTTLLLVFSTITFELYNTCFFLKKYSLKKMLLNYIPVVVFLSVMSIVVLVTDIDTERLRLWIFIPTLCVSVYYICGSVKRIFKIRKIAVEINKNEYSSDMDFPLNFAKNSIVWLAASACVLVLAVYVVDSLAFRAVADIILSMAFVAVIVFFPASYNKNVFIAETDSLVKKTHMSKARLEELSGRLLDLMEGKQLFRDSKLSMETLTGADAMNTNRVYVSQVISELGYKSFYDMVNQYRVEYAIRCIESDSEIQMKNLFAESGFSSHSAMNKAFNTYKGRTPVSYRK